MMKVLTVNSFDSLGGAAKAAYRLHSAVNNLGVSSTFCVSRKSINDATISVLDERSYAAVYQFFKPKLERLLLRPFIKNASPEFSLEFLPTSQRVFTSRDFDILHLHWINGLLNIPILKKIEKPMVWTLHDMWAFTGGCHYSLDCDRYEVYCQDCPFLKRLDLAKLMFRRKLNVYSKLDNLTIVTPSNWLKNCAKKSCLLANKRIEVIHNGIDLSVFKPVDKKIVRKILNIPNDKKLILFGAINATQDVRKGFDFLINSLKLFDLENEKPIIGIFGGPKDIKIKDFSLEIHSFGQVHDDITLSLIYSAADVVIIPSIQDNLPNIAVEALACGTPVVAFNIGGLPDIVIHKKNGYLAKFKDFKDLYFGIKWVLQNNNYKELAYQARRKAEIDFSVQKQAQKYIDLYKDLLDAKLNK
jgi:glycosyltransferase involved in cell wall biosynthesis